MRSSRVFAALAAAAFLSACADGTPTATDPQATHHSGRPNLILLLADDQRWDALGAAGNTIIQTPNLDQLARQGVYFGNSYVTSPVCMISRASMFSGQYASRHGILDFDTDFGLAAWAETYPALLRAAGYRNAFLGKFGVGNHPPAGAFDFWRGFAGQGVYEQTDSAGRPIHLTELLAEQAISFLQAQDPEHPFVLSLSFKAPHPQDEDPRQFIVDPRDAGLYAGVTIPTPATADERYWQALPAFFRADNMGRERWTTLFGTPALFQGSVKGYYRLVTGMDRAVGQIRAALQRLKLDGNTVIVYTSDNGFFLGEHGLAHKWYGYEESVRVPLIVYDPRQPASQRGRTEDRIALNVDVAPTLLDLAGVTAPARMQGSSLVPVLRRQGTRWRSDFFFEEMYPNPQIRRSAGVVGGRYKYLLYVDPQPNYEQLFDLQADPHETVDLARDPAYAGVLETMRQRYAELAAAAR
jgi:arylsulfatase A-like enzyme